MLAALDRIVDTLGESGATPASAAAAVDDAALGALTPLTRALLAGPAPRESLLGLRKLAVAVATADGDAVPRAWPQVGTALRAAASVLSAGPELTRLLVRRPMRLALLLDPALGQPWTLTQLRAALDARLAGIALAEAEAAAEQIVAFRNDQYVRLAAGEFGLATLEQVGRGLADLADVCLDAALGFALAALARVHGSPLAAGADGPRPCPVTVIAMGKYGAQELNFCSDIDIVFLYATDEGAAGALALHEFFTKVCQLVTRLLAEPTAEGFAFRVDLRLRPEGARGPLCNSVGGAERYYETWGGPYDRLAWLKARPCAGDLALGAEMVRLLRPFVFPRSIRPEVVEQIQELNRRIKAQQPRPVTAGWNVKLEAGGIREVEFFVQALQLLHAGKQPALQERATLRALDKLLFAGLIAEHEHRLLGESYELWRRIEHRLQLHDGRQTHLLPATGPLREHVVRHLGFAPEHFDRELAARRAQVSAIYATLGAEAVGAAVPEEEARLAPLLDPELPAEDGVRLLRAAGFAEAPRALEQLQLLAARPWGPLARAHAGVPAPLALPLLAELGRSPDPDAALRHVVDLALRVGPYEGTWRLLAENRPLLRLVCSLFGSSDFLARLFIRHPELLDQLVQDGRAQPQRGAEELGRDLAARLAAVEEGDVEGRLAVLGRFRNEETLRVGLSDIAGDLDLTQVWEQLSHVAEAILGELLPLVRSEMQSRYGAPREASGQPATLAVLGLGKLGGRELTYASDLDLIFIYSAPGVTDGVRAVDNSEFFARLVQRLIRALSSTFEEGSMYQVDTRLRPSGKQGTLVSSFAAFRDYHRTAQVWERQIVIKARAVAGDAVLGAAVERWIADYLYGSGADPTTDAAAGAALDEAALRAEIHRLRARMENELAEEEGGFYNLKLGRGGLLDVEFVAQSFQLSRGGRCPGLRVRSTLEALAAAEREGVLDAPAVATLVEGYRFLRRIEGALRIVRDRSAERLPAAAEGLEVMARRLGYREQLGASAGTRLLADYLARTAAIREIYGRLLGPAE